MTFEYVLFNTNKHTRSLTQWLTHLHTQIIKVSTQDFEVASKHLFSIRMILQGTKTGEYGVCRKNRTF